VRALETNFDIVAGLRVTLELWVDAPGTIGKAFVYMIRSGKQPRAKTLCLPALATKPSPC
jgi:hypothetical protein